MTGFCGLDFGTSNSCLAIEAEKIGADVASSAGESGAALVALEDGKPTIPSAIFFSFETNRPVFGRAAVQEYIDGEQGRLMRSLKSILASDLLHETTRVGRKRVSFADVVGIFLSHLKTTAEMRMGQEIDAVVLGRPVRFVGSTSDDGQAQAAQALVDIAKAQGFRAVETQYEPIAAALQYEAGVEGEELALIVDIGGGTSDFSIVRVSPERRRALDRSGDILGNSGVAIGGNDFDQRLSLDKAMPLFGFRAMVRKEMGDGRLEAPRSVYMDFSDWRRIMFSYTQSNLQMARTLRKLALDERLFARLETLIENRLAHQVADTVEQAKIALSEEATVAIDLGFVEAALTAEATKTAFEDVGAGLAEKIAGAVDDVLSEAGVAADHVGSVFMTGGSSNMPLLKALVGAKLPNARMTFGDMFGSVGLGLALDATRKFG